MQAQTSTTDLVLVGGGHSHLAVIKHFAMQPLAGLRITVISRDIHTPYSGMVPGLIAGHYQHDDAHIDLRPLCQFAGARLFHSQVTSINVELRQIHCNNRPPVRFDWLSINIGSQPNLASIPGAQQTGIAIKPIDGFLQHWQKTIDSLKRSVQPARIAVVGGGGASVEVALATQYQLQQTMGKQASQVNFELLCATPTLLPKHTPHVQRTMTQILGQRGIKIRTNCTVAAAQASPANAQHTLLSLNDQQQVTFDQVIWAIHAGSPTWLSATELDCDNNGFISVNPSLQSTSHPYVFAAGDIADFQAQPVAKSGVYAVRAGKVLAQNLRRIIQGKSLITYQPQKRFLSLMITGNKYAIASKGQWSAKGRWLWLLKNHIDKRFMKQFSQLPAMRSTSSPAPDLKTPGATVNGPAQVTKAYCGGCGAKVNQRTLSRVMQQLNPVTNDDVIIGLASPDDAAVINPPGKKHWLQTVDYFRALVDDPYLLGQIATNHCLSDIYAMGATPHSALAIATVPFGSNMIVEDTLLQLMQGAVHALNEQHTALIGGHSSEGSELGFGLSVNGTISPGHLLTKGKLTAGQALILTKALGTGTLFAANMQGKAQGRWIDQALQQMLINNRAAADIVYQHGATACTDITGFGLAGHLLEMLQAADIGAQLKLHSLPVMDGAIDCAKQGWLSSLHPENSKAEQAIGNRRQYQTDSLYPLLFDPQTAGGLLAAIPFDQARQCLDALKQHGYTDADVIGVVDAALPPASISLRK